jgi:hypothetical protein
MNTMGLGAKALSLQSINRPINFKIKRVDEVCRLRVRLSVGLSGCFALTLCLFTVGGAVFVLALSAWCAWCLRFRFKVNYTP